VIGQPGDSARSGDRNVSFGAQDDGWVAVGSTVATDDGNEDDTEDDTEVATEDETEVASAD
jgi:hypothetical protein